MTKNIVRGAACALALLLLASPVLAPCALAQNPPPPAATGHHSVDREKMHAMMQQHRDARARDLHTILNIRPDQEAAFAAFQTSMTPPPRNGAAGGRQWGQGEMATLTTPQKLDRMLAHMTERMDHMRKHIEATKAFYAALSPEQQRVFDALQRLHQHGGHGGWGRHRGGEHGGPGMGEGPPPPPRE